MWDIGPLRYLGFFLIAAAAAGTRRRRRCRIGLMAERGESQGDGASSGATSGFRGTPPLLSDAPVSFAQFGSRRKARPERILLDTAAVKPERLCQSSRLPARFASYEGA
jgi:hypothetical protein